MRAYFFVHSALSGIQKGLQVAHCAVKMSHRVRSQSHTSQTAQGAYWEWESNHETIIVLEGGFHGDLKEIADHFADYNKNLNPWALFQEDEETMNQMLTCVGIVLPERIYETAEMVRKHPPGTTFMPCPETNPKYYIIYATGRDVKEDRFDPWEVKLIEILNSRPLAR